MIKLKRTKKPEELTTSVIKTLTDKYKNDKKKNVWNKDYIKKALLKMSFEKCCYCETKINEESKYLEVEHFHPKSLYPDEVMKWENLLPSCKRCNSYKRELNTKIIPIINLSKDNPQEYLYLKDYRLYSYNKKGKGRNTIDNINLNDSQRLVDKRFAIGIKLIGELEILHNATVSYYNNMGKPDEHKNLFLRTLKNLMLEGVPESEYSATVATIILTNEKFLEIKKIFLQENLWSNELKNLEKKLKYCSLIRNNNL